MIRKILISILFLSVLLSARYSSAQTFEEYRKRVLAEFDSLKEQQHKNFEEYRDRINAEYATMMQQAWEKYNSHTAVQMPHRPEPLHPVIKEPSKKPQEDPKPGVVEPKLSKPKQDSIKPQPAIVPNIEPKPEPKVEPKPEPKVEPKPKQKTPDFKFIFYGMTCSVGMDNSFRFSLSDSNNKTIANAWQRLSNEKSYKLVQELMEKRSLLSLCDWGYVKMIEKLATAYYGNYSNEARLFQIFILVQSGYKVRIGCCDNKIILMLPFDDPNTTLYGYTYVTKNGMKYYLIDKSLGKGAISLFDKEFPNERICSLEIGEQLILLSKQSNNRTLISDKYPQMELSMSTNINLVDFYNEYPHTDNWSIYVKAPFDSATQSMLYDELREYIAGKSKSEAANMLLNFVQTAFQYKTDHQQFGYERPLFCEELFFYPYCDCEDRSILYSKLVRELLGLDVVLLNYDKHIATAINLGQEIEGDYIDYKGKRYLICDPTYINADIGDAMPNAGDIIGVIEIQ